MSLLTNGLIAQILSNATDPLLMYDITLHPATDGTNDNIYGEPDGSFEPDVPARGFVDQYDDFRKRDENIPETDVKILVLRQGHTLEITTDFEVTAKGVRYTVEAVDTDPAEATWTLQGRPTGA